MEEEQKPKRGGITNNFYGPVGQYIAHVEHNHFGMTPDGEFIQITDDESGTGKKPFPELPSPETMCKAVVATISDGLWWGNRSWAVVYRVWQMKGYMGSIKKFVEEVEQWQLQTDYICNYDAVQKPIAEGKMIGPVEKWKANGATEQSILLAEALLRFLDNNHS